MSCEHPTRRTPCCRRRDSKAMPSALAKVRYVRSSVTSRSDGKIRLDCFLDDRHPRVEEPALELHYPG